MTSGRPFLGSVEWKDIHPPPACSAESGAASDQMVRHGEDRPYIRLAVSSSPGAVGRPWEKRRVRMSVGCLARGQQRPTD